MPIRISVSVVFFNTQSFCCLNSRSTTAKYFGASSLAMQRASIDPAAALMSSGNSRNTKRILPLSMNSDLILGKTFSVNAAQCGQVIEAYSVMVTVAFAGPSAMSGSDCGLATSAAPCASASIDQPQRREAGEGGKPGQRKGGGEGAARDDQGQLPIGAFTPEEIR